MQTSASKWKGDGIAFSFVEESETGSLSRKRVKMPYIHVQVSAYLLCARISHLIFSVSVCRAFLISTWHEKKREKKNACSHIYKKWDWEMSLIKARVDKVYIHSW